MNIEWVPLSKANTRKFNFTNDPYLPFDRTTVVNKLLLTLIIQLAGISHLKFEHTRKEFDEQKPYMVELLDIKQLEYTKMWPRAIITLNTLQNREIVNDSPTKTETYAQNINKALIGGLSEVSEIRNFHSSKKAQAIIDILGIIGLPLYVFADQSPLDSNDLRTLMNNILISSGIYITAHNAANLVSGAGENSAGQGNQYSLFMSVHPERHAAATALMSSNKLTKVIPSQNS